MPLLILGAIGFPAVPASATGAGAAFCGNEMTWTHASGEGLHGIRSGGNSHMARSNAACNATATPNHANSRRRSLGLGATRAAAVMIAGEDCRYCAGVGNSLTGARDAGGRISGNLIT